MDYGYYLEKYDIDESRLKEYGFERNGEVWEYSKDLQDGLKLIVNIGKGALSAKVWDTDFGDEYLPFNVVEEESGLHEQADAIMEDIAKNCFVCHYVRRRIIDELEKRFCTPHEAPWEDDPTSITFKTIKSKKWYAIMMQIYADKLGLNAKNKIDVVNIKLPPDEIDSLIDGRHFFRAYHMNKVHWLTIKLDKDLDFDKFFELAGESYFLAESKKGK